MQDACIFMCLLGLSIAILTCTQGSCVDHSFYCIAHVFHGMLFIPQSVYPSSADRLWVTSNLGPLQTKLSRTRTSKPLREHVLSFVSGEPLGVEWGYHMVDLFQRLQKVPASINDGSITDDPKPTGLT